MPSRLFKRHLAQNARKVLLKASFGVKNARECSGGRLKEMKSVLISLTRPSDVFVEEGHLVAQTSFLIYSSISCKKKNTILFQKIMRFLSVRCACAAPTPFKQHLTRVLSVRRPETL